MMTEREEEECLLNLAMWLRKRGRVDVDHPRITGHRGPVVDLKFNPFNENEIASCSDDGTVKVWYIPNDGLKADTYQWKVDLHGHQRRVDYIEWHPTAQNLILSAGLDHQVVLWNVERAEPIQVFRCHPDAIQSITWNRNGSLFATTCKDKHIRVIDPRTGRIIAVGKENFILFKSIDEVSLERNGSSRSKNIKSGVFRRYKSLPIDEIWDALEIVRINSLEKRKVLFRMICPKHCLLKPSILVPVFLYHFMIMTLGRFI